MRWAAEFKAAVGNEFVRFGPDRSLITEGEDVLLRARWKPNFLRRFPDVTAAANVYPAGQRDEAPIMSLALKPDLDSSLLHKATATGLQAGNYEVELQIEGAEVVDRPIVAELIVAPQLTNELADLAADRELLQQIARETGREAVPSGRGEPDPGPVPRCHAVLERVPGRAALEPVARILPAVRDPDGRMGAP